MTTQRMATASLALSLLTALLAGYLALRPEPALSSDVSYVARQLGSVSDDVFSLSEDVAELYELVDSMPAAEPTDLSAIEAGIENLDRHISDVRGSLGDRFDYVEGRLNDVCFGLSQISPQGCD